MSIGKLIDNGGMRLGGQRVSNTSTQQRGLQVVSATSNMAALAATTRTWTKAREGIVIPPEWAIVALSFFGFSATDPDNATFKFDVFVADISGGLEMLASGVEGVIGTMQLSHNPATGEALDDGDPDADYCWADTLTGTGKTTSTIAFSDYQGDNGLAKIKFDRHSAVGIYVRIYDIVGATSITCVLNGFNQ